MIDRQQLLADLKPLLKRMEADLRARCDEVPQIDADLNAEYEQARTADRTGITFEEWRADLITQVAVAWILSCVFVRFLEDNVLIAPPRISGPLHGAGTDAGLQRARDERDTYFKTHPKQTDRDYLLATFDTLSTTPGTKDVFGPHNPALAAAYRNWLSGDAAQKLIEFFQKIDADGTGELVHDFTDPITSAGGWDTRFLGDLYQDLSEAARKKYALLQTPIFVEEFILERTLEPAINEFGLKDFKMINPACGSGHFLLGAFARILKHWRTKEPAASDRELVNRTLASVHGVDLNPYAIAIARFRLLLLAMAECQITRLADAPDFAFNLVCGDSLLHGKGMQQSTMDFHELSHVYQAEDLPELQRILAPGLYHAVVANPPYINPTDRALNDAYRKRFTTCYRQYSLGLPFIEKIFSLAVLSGFTGQITGNSFITAEFGKRLIEDYLPKVDLEYVIDASGVRIPGHGTPTVLLFGRQRSPIKPTVRAALGIKGDSGLYSDASQNKVWQSIIRLIDTPGNSSEFMSVDDVPRTRFMRHPWAIGGGGIAELKALIDSEAVQTLDSLADSIGFYQDTHADDFFVQPKGFANRKRLSSCFRKFVRGDDIRDWCLYPTEEEIFFPYSDQLEQWKEVPSDAQFAVLHSYRTLLWSRSTFGGGTYKSAGRPWFDYHQFPRSRAKDSRAIAYAFVAERNHFVEVADSLVFGRSAPLLRSSDDNWGSLLSTLGILNSSIACFWMKQVCYPKGGDQVGEDGSRVRTSLWDLFFNFNATPLESLPLPRDRPGAVGQKLSDLAARLATQTPNFLARNAVSTAELFLFGRAKYSQSLGELTALQEELDWECYHLYGLADRSVYDPTLDLSIDLGQRAFEIVLARQMEAGEVETTWFTRHGSTPITEIPKEWPEAYRALVQKRIDLIQTDKNIGLIEKPEYKRRWNAEPWEQQQERALRSWLLDRLESFFDLDGRMNDQKKITATGDLRQPKLTSVAILADIARQDKEFMQVAELFAGRMDFDVGTLLGELVAAESVPALPILRYKPAGLDKRQAWERTWVLQREEDRLQARIDALTAQWKQAEKEGKPTAALQSEVAAIKTQMPKIPVPEKYTSVDFLSGNVWRLRGKLDVPKERWVSFPHCEGEDGTLVIAWAGYDHLQLARAIAERYELAKEQQGVKLVPLLAAIDQLIPWLKQWHNDVDPTFGTRMGDYFENYLAEEAKAIGQSVEQVRAWSPPAKIKKQGRTKVPIGTGGFPDSNRDILLIAAGLALVGPNGVSEEMHLDAMILMTNSERCRAITASASTYDEAIEGIDPDFWTDTAAKWKHVRDLLRQAKAVEIDPHNGSITRKDPLFSMLRERYGKTLDTLAQLAIEAAGRVPTATSTIQRQQQKSRKREQEAA